MSALRLAVVGAGHLGRIHTKLAAGNDQFELVAVADPSAASRQLVEEQFSLKTVADYRELVGTIDAAIVAAPTELHYEITNTLLRGGAHCLVEKPLADTPDQAQRMVQVAKSHGRVLQVGHVERFNPTWVAAQPTLQRPKFIEAVRSGPYSGRSTDVGVVLDLMIHDLDLILSMDSSDITDVRASGIAVVGSHEDLAEARIEFASGLVANLRASRLATAPTRSMQIFTPEAYATLDFSADEVQLIQASEEVLARQVALDELSAEERVVVKEQIFQRWLRPQIVPAPKRNAILDEHNDFALSIHSGCRPSVTGEDGARAVLVADRIVQALNQRNWDGASSKPWRIGALASQDPQILSLPTPLAPQAAPVRKAG